MLTIQALTGSHDRSKFECGNAALDLWLRTTAIRHQKKGISRTFVAICDDEPSHVLGYYALTACELASVALPESLARKLPRSVPGVRLGRLAFARAMRRQGLGELLLVDAIHRARLVMAHIGVNALFVDAKDEEGVRFCQGYGFKPLPDSPLALVLPLSGIGNRNWRARQDLNP